MRALFAGAAVALSLGAVPLAALQPARAAEGIAPPALEWPQAGPFGVFDRPALQRGYQVYKEVCAACHSMRLLSYRNLQDIGFSEDQVKAIAAQDQVAVIDDNGDAATRPGLPSDPFHSPFPNESAARASNGGALPPDLSLMAKARKDGTNYLAALLTGFSEPPADVKMADGKYYNEYFPGHQIGMPPPLTADQVTYEDGTAATVPQMAHDVATFLSWAAEPKLEERKRLGLKVMAFLAVLSVLTYLCYRRVRRRVQGH